MIKIVLLNKDSTSKGEKAESVSAWLEAGVQVDIIDILTPPLNGASFFFRSCFRRGASENSKSTN